MSYDVTVPLYLCALYPHLFHPCSRLIIEHAELTPDKEAESDRDTVYTFSWITNGYSKTKSGSRVVIPITFVLDGITILAKFQAKFYEYGNGQHLTWGQPANVIELVCSSDPVAGAEVESPPLEIKFK